MSEQKVWVEKMPENCDECPCSLRGKDDCAYCNLLHKNIGYDFGKRPKHCCLINIKDHDRELVRQVCEDIKQSVINMYYAEDQEDDSIEQAIVVSRNEAVDEFIDILNQIQKEFEK